MDCRPIFNFYKDTCIHIYRHIHIYIYNMGPLKGFYRGPTLQGCMWHSGIIMDLPSLFHMRTCPEELLGDSEDIIPKP